MTKRRPAAATARALGCTTLALMLGSFLRAPQAQAQTRPTSNAPARAATEALAWLDGDAGVILGVQLSQLQQLGDLAATSAPDARGSISLATLGVSAVLGWSPLQDSAWSGSGFALDSSLYLQLEALDAKEASAADRGKGTALWRTRLILPASDAARAKEKLASIRFRERIDLEGKDIPGLAALLGIGAGKAKTLQARLQKAGTFLVARPSVVPGLLLISQKQNLFVIDLVRPYGPSPSARKWSQHQDALVQAVQRRPDTLATIPDAMATLESGKIALWLSPLRIAELLLALELDGVPRGGALRRAPVCAGFRDQALSGHFQALSLRANIAPKTVALDLRWHLRKSSALPSLLSTADAPLLRYQQQSLYALVGLDHIGRLRGLERPPVAQTWDALWKRARRCHPLAGTLAVADDWPRIAGLFLEELAVLHPQASTLIDNLGAVALAVPAEDQSQLLFAEAWLRQPAPAIAKSWLRTLFGHEQVAKNALTWGRGPMRPYALAFAEGEVIGSNLLGAAQAAPDLVKLRDAPRGGGEASLILLRANPSALQTGRWQQPWTALLATWLRLSASFTLDKDQLRFTIDLQKD